MMEWCVVASTEHKPHIRPRQFDLVRYSNTGKGLTPSAYGAWAKWDEVEWLFEQYANLEEQLEAAQRQLNTEAGWTANDLERERKLKEQNQAADARIAALYAAVELIQNERDGLLEQLEAARLEVGARDEILDWIAENVPQAIELCPFKRKAGS